MPHLADFHNLEPVLSAAAMREADRRTIEELGLPGLVLMEAAGRAVADCATWMLEDLPNPRVVIVCGRGNNGGDGLVAARLLAGKGIRVDVLLAAGDPEAGKPEPGKLPPGEPSPNDAAAGLTLLRRLGNLDPDLPLSFVDKLPDRADLIVDALLGTGLSSEVRQPLAGLITQINSLECSVLAVDVPSGIDSDTGAELGTAIRADVTVSLGARKTGLFVGAGPDHAGEVIVADIGIPPSFMRQSTSRPSSALLSNDDFVRSRLRGRTRQDHKYTSGPTIVMGGSAAFPGAPVLAAMAAARIGSGYVRVYCPEDVQELIQRKLNEIPVMAFSDGGADQDLERGLSKAKSLLIGPGLGREEGTRVRIQSVLDRFDGPVVLDADALYLLQDAREWVSERSKGRWIMTPHDGEFARMGGQPDAGGGRVEAARSFAGDWNVVLLLKGQPSLTAEPDGRVVINSSGGPASGTAGSGDVLAGMVAGLLAQGIEPFEAAVCAIHVGGLAVDRFTASGASQSMMAGDILNELPALLSGGVDTSL